MNMSGRLRDLECELRRRSRAPRQPKREAAPVRPQALDTGARRLVRALVVDFGEPVTFGAGPVTLSVDPAAQVTDVAWETAIQEALTAQDFRAAAFASDDAAHVDDEPEGEPEPEGEDDAAEPEPEGEAERKPEKRDYFVAASAARPVDREDQSFWAAAQAADELRAHMLADPEAFEEDAVRDDAEAEADAELQRDLDALKARPQPAPAPPDAAAAAPAPLASAHSIFDQMSFATTYDVGTFSLTRTFDAFDAELDRQARKQSASAPPPAPARVDPDEAAEDLAWIQQAIAATPAPAEPQSPCDDPETRSAT
jgi:hypothetical protein